jgi:hypothetical protein
LLLRIEYFFGEFTGTPNNQHKPFKALPPRAGQLVKWLQVTELGILGDDQLTDDCSPVKDMPEVCECIVYLVGHFLDCALWHISL